MPPKQRTPAPAGPQTTTTTSTPARSTKSASGNNAQDILQGIWSKYVNKTPQRVKLLDTFMVFLMVVGALQFLYVVLVGNFVRITHHSYVGGPGNTLRTALCSWIDSRYRHVLIRYTLANNPHSPSTPSSPASAQPSANSSSQPRSASRRTQRTRPNSRTFHMSGRLPTLCSGRYCCTFSA
jgi:hypothetical protein